MSLSKFQLSLVLKSYLLFLGVKLTLILLGIFLVNTGITQVFFTGLQFQDFEFNALFKLFFNNDSGWYKSIAVYGYNGIPLTESANWTTANQHYAFFPLLPYSIRFISYLLHCDFYVSGFILNLIVLYFFVYYFIGLIKLYLFDDSRLFKLMLFVAVFPFSMHLFFIYTESLFFTLLLASFYFIYQKKWYAFALASALLVLTRPNGLFMIIPFYFLILEQDGKLNFKSLLNSFLKIKTYILLIMPFTFFLWLYYQYINTGNWFAFANAQAGWGKKTMFPFFAFFRSGFWQQQFLSVYTILMIIYAITKLKKWKLSVQMLVWINVLLPLTAGSVTSMSRYLSILFPYYIEWSDSKFYKKHYSLIIASMIVLSVLAFHWWLQGNSIMY